MKIDIMKNNDIYNMWSCLIIEYEEYFTHNDEKWYSCLEQV